MAIANANSSLGDDRGMRQRVANQVGVSRQRVSYAFTVLEHAPELADQVLAGGSLNEAYGIALERKAAREAEEAREKAAYRHIEQHYPDYVGKMQSEELTLAKVDEAQGAVWRGRPGTDGKARHGGDGNASSPLLLRY